MNLPRDRVGQVWSSAFYVFLVVRSRPDGQVVLVLATSPGGSLEPGLVTPFGGDESWEEDARLTRLE